MTRRKTAQQKGKTTDAKAAVRFGPLAGWVGFNLRMAQESAFEAFSHLSREIGESPGRFATLTLIAENPGISQSTLGRAAGRDKSSMTPVLDDLVDGSSVKSLTDFILSLARPAPAAAAIWKGVS